MLRVSFNTFPPWKMLDQNGNPDGIDIAFLRIIADRMGLTLKFIHFPFKRGLKSLEHGEVDIMTGVLRRPEREKYLHFLEPPYKNRTNKAFYVLKGREDSISRYEELHSLIIGTQLGGRYFPRFDSDPAIEKVEVKDTGLNVKMLLAGRIDAFVTTETVGDYRLAQLDMTHRIGKARYVHCREQHVYMALSKRSHQAHRLPEFNRIMRELVEQGEFERVKAKYLSPGMN